MPFRGPLQPMNPQEIYWLAGSLATLISLHFGIYRFVNSLESDEHPRQIAVVLSLLVTSIVSVAAFVTTKWYVGAIPLYLGFGLLLLFLWILTQRVNKIYAIEDELTKSLQRIDQQISYILALLVNQEDVSYVRDVISKALEYTLSEIERVIQHKQEPANPLQVSLFKVNPGNVTRFKVIASHRGQPKHARVIEAEFYVGERQDNKPRGIAGKAAHDGETVYISDLSDSDSEDAKDWISFDAREESKQGTIISIPFRKGSGDGRTSELEGVVSAHSINMDAFAKDPAEKVTGFYLDKIEILIYCQEITNLLDGSDDTSDADAAG